MDNRNKPIYNNEQLENNIIAFIKEERKNLKLANYITRQFISRGLNPLKVKQLFESMLEPKDIDKDEKIAFITSIYDYFKNDENKLNEPHIAILKPINYFYDNVISENRLLQPKKEPKMDKIVFENVQRLNNEEYQTFLKASQLYELKKNGLLVYYKNIQRATKIEKIGNITVKRENYNKKTLENMTKEYSNKNMLATQITLTIVVFKNRIPNIDFIPEYNDCIGKFIFVPNFNSEDDDYAFLCVNDGAHRIASLISSYTDNGVDNSISVAIKVIDEARAKDYSAKSFMQATSDKIYTKTLENNPYNRFINTIIENTKIFEDNIAKTKQESKLDNILGNYLDMVEVIKLLEIGMNNEIKATITAQKMSKTINQVVDLIADNYNGSIEDMKKNSELLSKNSALLYLFVSNKLLNKNEEEILNTSLELIQNQEKICKILNLKSTKLIIEKLDKLLCKEDIENVL